MSTLRKPLAPTHPRDKDHPDHEKWLEAMRMLQRYRNWHPREKDHPEHAQWVERIRESMLKRWKRVPKKQRAALAKRAGEMSQQRWKKPQWRSKQARSEFAAYVSSHIKERTAGGRPRITDRCACGRYSKTLAEKRGHRCVAPAEGNEKH